MTIDRFYEAETTFPLYMKKDDNGNHIGMVCVRCPMTLFMPGRTIVGYLIGQTVNAMFPSITPLGVATAFASRPFTVAVCGITAANLGLNANLAIMAGLGLTYSLGSYVFSADPPLAIATLTASIGLSVLADLILKRQ